MATLTNQNGTSGKDILTYNKQGTYHALAGNDNIKVTGGSGIVVHTDSGNNLVYVTGGSLHTIKVAESNADSDKQNGVEELGISGADIVDAYLGAGKDIISLINTNGRKENGALAQIHGGAWGDTFIVRGGTQKYQLYGDAGNDVFNVEGGEYIVFWGGAAADTFNIKGGKNNKYYGGDSGDVFEITGGITDVSGQQLILGYGNDVVNVREGNSHQIKGNLGINEINIMAGYNHVVTADIDKAVSKNRGYTDAQINNGEGIGHGVDKLNISDTASGVKANLGDGKDVVVVTAGKFHMIHTEGWGDTIEVGGSTNQSNFYAGAGDDTISVYGQANNNLVDTGAGNDFVDIYGGSYTKVKVGSGNNKVQAKSSYHNTVTTDSKGKLDLTVNSGATFDSITITNEYTKINAAQATSGLTLVKVEGTGKQLEGILTSAKDVVKLFSGSKHQVQAGAGADDIRCSDISESTIFGQAGNDYILLQGTQSTAVDNLLYGGDGVDEIHITGGKNNQAFGEAGDDKLVISDVGIHIGMGNSASGGNGNDTIEVYSMNCSAYGDAGSDWITLSGCTYSEGHGGDDDDTLTVDEGGTYNHLYGQKGDDYLYIKGSSNHNTAAGGDGVDRYYIEGNGSEGFNTLLGGSDVSEEYYTINNSHRNTVSGAEGCDFVTVSSSYGTIIYGEGDDDYLTLKDGCNYTDIHGNEGTDTITIHNKASYSKISGDEGNDYINFKGSQISEGCLILGGSGTDFIYLEDYVTKSTVKGGLGNDRISVGGNSNPPLIQCVGNKLVGGPGSDTYSVDIRRHVTFVDAVTNQGANDKDIVEIYVDSANFELQIQRDVANNVQYYTNAKGLNVGGVLVKGYDKSNVQIKFYDIKDFKTVSKTDLTQEIMDEGSYVRRDLSNTLASFGAEAYGNGYSKYNSLEYFKNDDLRISGNM